MLLTPRLTSVDGPAWTSVFLHVLCEQFFWPFSIMQLCLHGNCQMHLASPLGCTQLHTSPLPENTQLSVPGLVAECTGVSVSHKATSTTSAAGGGTRPGAGAHPDLLSI